MNEHQDSVRTLYQTFREQGVPVVYAIQCCGRFYLGREPALRCRTCDVAPKNVEIRAEVDLDNLYPT